jgi:hypothetical protein
MARADTVFLPASEFDDFLFAEIGGHGDRMPLSVLSALARLDIDPWGEAAELARLSKGPATERLASLIARLPDGLSATIETQVAAARLIALLPRRAIAIPALRQIPSGDGIVPNSRAIALCGALMACLLLAGWVMATRQSTTQAGHSTTQGGNASAAVSSEALPGTPPSSTR